MNVEFPEELETVFVFKYHIAFNYKCYELIEEAIAVGNNLLLVYRYDYLSDDTEPKKHQNVRLCDNEGNVLWTVQNPLQDIIFLGVKREGGCVQLIASDGNLYTLNMETGDIGLGGTEDPSQSQENPSCSWYSLPPLKHSGMKIKIPPEKIITVSNKYRLELYKRDDVTEKFLHRHDNDGEHDLLVYKPGFFYIEGKEEKCQYIQLLNYIGIVWTVKNPFDDFFVNATHDNNGGTHLISSRGKQHAIDLKTGAIQKCVDGTLESKILRLLKW